MPGRSVWPTASDSMLKLRARTRRGHPVEDAGPVVDEDDEHVAVPLARARDIAQGLGALDGSGQGIVHGSHLAGLRRRAPRLDEVGQALAGRHHREHVLGLGDLEPDERRTVVGLRGADGTVDLVGGRGPEAGEAVGLGQLGPVGAGRSAEW